MKEGERRGNFWIFFFFLFFFLAFYDNLFGSPSSAPHDNGEEGKEGVVGGCPCCQVVVRARHLNPGSEYFDRMMSLDDPKIRLHSTIWISRGSWEAILKNPLVKGSTVLSLVTTKESE